MTSLANPSHLRSTPCRQIDFSASWYRYWTQVIGAAAIPLHPEQEAVWGAVWAGMRGKHLHRKLWEWASIAQALSERGMLRQGARGIGFAVGSEPLPSLFAARGCEVLATDYVGGDGGWGDTGQLAASAAAVHWRRLISQAEFDQRVTFRDVDMRDLSGLPRERYDFAWSSCSFEHLGSLEAGMDFVVQSMELIRPGGVAVHTTEYNLTSNDQTWDTGHSVIYRRRDIEELDRRLRLRECGIVGLSFEAGTEEHDLAYDRPPYYQGGRQHVTVQLGEHVSTSIRLIVRKA